MQIVDKYRNTCRKHVLHGRCTDPRCPRDHTMLPEAERKRLWNASLELYPVEFSHEETQAHTLNIPLCRYLKSTNGCKLGDQCQWRHDDTAKEWARAKKVRDERSKAGAKAPSAAGVWAEEYDVDDPWKLSSRMYDAAEW